MGAYRSLRSLCPQAPKFVFCVGAAQPFQRCFLAALLRRARLARAAVTASGAGGWAFGFG